MNEKISGSKQRCCRSTRSAKTNVVIAMGLCVVAINALAVPALQAQQVPPVDVFPPTAANVVLMDNDDNFVYGIAGLTPAQFLDADAIIGWGTDLNTTEFVGIVQTGNPAVFLFVVDGKQSGTFKFDFNQEPSATWKDNQGREGYLVFF